MIKKHKKTHLCQGKPCKLGFAIGPYHVVHHENGDHDDPVNCHQPSHGLGPRGEHVVSVRQGRKLGDIHKENHLQRKK